MTRSFISTVRKALWDRPAATWTGLSWPVLEALAFRVTASTDSTGTLEAARAAGSWPSWPEALAPAE
ncbi:hypothetical protein CE91St43_28010 [Oscillospiraceae bacterium]|nr:hypothetical protein CE91St43_28010 [Oscillospiraceae bacterium]